MWAFPFNETAGVRSYGGSTATWTMLTADEHHAEAGSTSDGREPRAAVLAERVVGRRGGTAHRTIECFSVHRGVLNKGRNDAFNFLTQLVFQNG